MIHLENVMKMSWRYLCNTSWRRFEEFFNITWQEVLKMSWIRLQDVLKMSWRRFCKRLENKLNTSWRRMTKTNILIKTSWKRLEYVFWRRIIKVNIFVLIKSSRRYLLKTKTKDVFKTSLRRLHEDKCLLGTTKGRFKVNFGSF